MNLVYLLLGSNLSNRTRMLEMAREGIQERLGPVVKASSIYESEPWGFISENRFLNQVIAISTSFNPQQLLEHILRLEEDLGRQRGGQGYISRTIDIDILFYNDRIIRQSNLTIPHPRISERMFTLVPLMELAENMIHPSFHKTIGQLLMECKDDDKVELYAEEIKS